MIADICAGSGAFGFEMLSRGAENVHFVDNSQDRCKSIISHAHQFDVEKQCKIFTTDIRAYLKTCSFLYDIIYYDPPYNNLELIEIIPDILKFLSQESVLIFEYKKTNKYSDIFTKNNTGNYQKNIKKFGKTELCFFTRISDSNK
jgi:16S rRNA (guanine(966)-N(2))-methyltransferase RsmD